MQTEVWLYGPSGGPVILGLETSGTTGGAALLDGEKLIASLSFTSAELYSQRLLPSVEWLLERAGIPIESIDGVAISRGPGSFTGLRIGMSAAKAIAFANNAPIVGVSTLEALALRALCSGHGRPVCTLLDARQGEVYAGLFQLAADPPPNLPSAQPTPMPRIVRLQEDSAGHLGMLSDWVTEPTLFAGEGAFRYHTELQALLGDKFCLTPSIRNLPSAEEVAWIGAQRLARGEHDDPLLLEPDYLRRAYMEKGSLRTRP